MNSRSILVAVLLLTGLVFLHRPEDGSRRTTTGVERVLIVHEQSTNSTDFATELRKLKLHESASWFTEKGITVQVLDQNSVEGDGKPASIVARFAPYRVPELLFITKDAAKLVKRQPCPDTAEKILAACGKK